jgi:gluconolactonase
MEATPMIRPALRPLRARGRAWTSRPGPTSRLLRSIALLTCVAAAAGCDIPGRGIFEPFQRPQMLLGQDAVEGPAWHPAEGLYFSGSMRVSRLGADGQAIPVDEQVAANGLYFDRNGDLLACEPYARKVLRLAPDGHVEILADRYEGKAFNSPNDLVVDSKGRIYFSDPRYGKRDTMEILDDEGRPVEGVYRIDPDGRITRIISHEVDRPNGLAISDDDAWLYVSDNNSTTEGGAHKLWRFDLREDGGIDPESRRLLYDWGTDRGPYGIALDQEGRLYVAAGRDEPKPPFETADEHKSGIYVFSPSGDLLDVFLLPGPPPSNCVFGGPDLRTLYVTALGPLWSIRTVTPGAQRWSRYSNASPPRSDLAN